MATQQYDTAPSRNASMSAMADEADSTGRKEGRLIILELFDDGSVSVMSEGQEEQQFASIDEALPAVQSMAGAAPEAPMPMDQGMPPEPGAAPTGNPAPEQLWNQVAAERPAPTEEEDY